MKCLIPILIGLTAIHGTVGSEPRYVRGPVEKVKNDLHERKEPSLFAPAGGEIKQGNGDAIEEDDAKEEEIEMEIWPHVAEDGGEGEVSSCIVEMR